MKGAPAFCTIIFAALSFFLTASSPSQAISGSCAEVVQKLNNSLSPRIDEQELAEILGALNSSNNTRLPVKFVTKKQAKMEGWSPGVNLWSISKLKGKSIGGDVFHNRERKLPNGGRSWHEADLDYRGGKRGAKRLVYANDGLRMVTVDHYRTFREVPSCQ